MGKIQFNPSDPGGLELTRAIVLERLSKDNSWKQYDLTGSGFDPFVEYVGDDNRGRRRLTFLVQDVLWEFMIQGVIAPGLNISNPNLPWFHLTEYGEKVLAAGGVIPHDASGYLEQFRSKCPKADKTVVAYLTESLLCFTTNNLIASVVMLGVASERAFILLCEALLKALSDSKEAAKFKKLLERNAIKPKQDFVIKKIDEIRRQHKRALPDNLSVMLGSIFDFIRCQRNDLGHPRSTPPSITREEAFVVLLPISWRTTGRFSM